MSTPIFIAEVKTESPYGYRSQRGWSSLLEIAAEHGDWVSVHTDVRWGGSWDVLWAARQSTKKPILAKGIHSLDSEIEKAFDLGADYVLCVGRVPQRMREGRSAEWFDRVIVEPAFYLRNALDARDYSRYASKLCYNSRNITNGDCVGTPSSGMVRAIDKDPDLWLCQASGIRSVDQIYSGYDAFIVGEHLEEFVKEYKHEAK